VVLGGFYSKIQNCSTIFDKENLKITAHYSYIKTIKFECTDKTNFEEHLKIFPYIMGIPYI
jgi:hypothetical protein